MSAALWRLEVRLLWRHRVVAVLAGLTAGWGALLLALPPAGARAATPWLLLLETGLAGTTIAGALVILERDQGMRAALAVTPVRPGQRLATAVGPLTGLTVASAAGLALAGRVPPADLPVVLLGVGLTALLTLPLAVAVAAYRRSVLTFLTALPLPLLPLLAPALAHAAGVRHPVLYASPLTAAADLLHGAYPPPVALAWLLLAGAGAGVLAGRRLALPRAGRVRGGAPGDRPAGDRAAGDRAAGDRAAGDRAASGGSAVDRRPAVDRRAAGRRPARGPVRAFLRTDLAAVRRDPMLLAIALSPLLLGLALRFGYPPVQGWLREAYGFDLDPYRPVLLAAAVLLHLPASAGMMGAMLVLDDVDGRALVALRTSPLTMTRYLGLRAGTVTVAAWLGLAVAVPLTGLVAPGSWSRLLPAAALAGLVAPLFLLATLALARNKVEGVAVVKALNLGFYLPLVTWWLTGPAGWPFAVLPTWWPLQAQWHGWGYAVAGCVVALAALVPLAARVHARLATG